MFLSRATYSSECIYFHTFFCTGPPWESNPQLWHCKRHALPIEPHGTKQMVNAYISFILYLYLPETYTKFKSKSAIQAEPSALHFSGFKLGKNYQRSLKLINISSEVINIHIIPTQTKHFKTKYLKKHRLVPGLSYTVKVHFCPAEWRYFYDCIRVHCKGEENLQVPVHAYPITDDLHIPTHITIPAVPLGQKCQPCDPSELQLSQ
ncbi:cilia- and flagella-associated protein 221-like [Salmo trutta]|uniref:cilia- and flagella-associated protein 221-like n=1 Tax=Salmo trutta TaxID=8032 RepID=UPI00113082E3|nr:cilia- and flagella-associated protein 221-like [Salmo trutta]